MFKFKRHKRETGLSGIGHSRQGSDIKIDKMLVGTILPPNWSCKGNNFRVRFMVVDTSVKCGWKSITLTKISSSDSEMRDWLKLMYNKIVSKYNLYKCEPY